MVHAAQEQGEVVRADRPYALVTLVNTVMLLYMPLLSVVLPLWIVGRTAAPACTASPTGCEPSTGRWSWTHRPVGRRSSPFSFPGAGDEH